MLGAACSTSEATEAETSTDAIRREGETTDTSDQLDPSQCEAILARATAAVKSEGLAANPKRMLLSSKDVSCLAFEVAMRQRVNDQNQSVANPYDVLLPQLFFAAHLGSQSNFGSGSGTGTSGSTPPPPPPGPAGDTVKVSCPSYPNIQALNIHRVTSVTERQACTAFGRGLNEFLATRGLYKTFLEDDVEILIAADGAPITYDDRQRQLSVPWHVMTTGLQRLTSELVKAKFDASLKQRGTYDQPRYADNQRLVELKQIALDPTFVAHASEAVQLRFTVERAAFEGNATSCYDYVLIQNAQGQELRKICNGQTGSFDVPLSNSYKIVLFSDGGTNGDGAKLSWQPVLR